MKKIIHLTTAHPPDDIRIYKKEVLSLLDNGFNVKYLVPITDDANLTSDHIGIKKSKSRLKRMLVDNYRIFSKVKEIKPDIVHFHDPEFLIFALLLKKYKNIVLIYDAHEDLPKSIMSKPYINKNLRRLISIIVKYIEDYISNKMDYVVTATPSIEQKFLKVNKNTICLNNYPILDELYITETREKENYVCYVGGLSQIRGSKILANASNQTDISIKVAGNTRDLEYPNKLDLLGNLNRKEVSELLAKSIAGIVTFMPEPNHINARPNKMFEYMSAGIPVIASHFKEWEEIILKHNCGLTVNPENPSELVKAMEYLRDNPDKANEMGINGKNAVSEKYNWNHERQKLISLYKKLEEI